MRSLIHFFLKILVKYSPETSYGIRFTSKSDLRGTNRRAADSIRAARGKDFRGASGTDCKRCQAFDPSYLFAPSASYRTHSRDVNGQDLRGRRKGRR